MVRVEFFLPDLPDARYSHLQSTLERELTYAVGGCSLIQGAKGLFHSRSGKIVQDRINLLIVDVNLRIVEDRNEVEAYVDNVQRSVAAALDEEKILIVVHGVWHSL
jgi:hypothetical protein